MKKINWILTGIGGVIMIVLLIWIMVLRNKLDNITEGDKDKWREKYEEAADSLEIIAKERDSLRIERDYLDSTRRYWAERYNHKDSLLKQIQIQYNEDMSNIRNATATEHNSMLSDRISEIYHRRR